MPESHPETSCARPAAPVPSASLPLVPPLALSAVYEVGGLDDVDALYEHKTAGFVYARDGHPNAAQLAAKVARLESAEAGFIGASGMAAESAALLSMLDGGGHVALSDGLYGKTVTLVARELSRFGVTHSTFDATAPEDLRRVLRPATRVVFVETLSNPLLRVADIPGLSAVCRTAGVPLIVDHTFAPLLCRPIELGADLVVHSLTKFIAGHSDVTLGFLGGSKEPIDRAASVGSTFGLSGNPFDCWLALRGLATLGVRMPRACANALALAERIATHRAVRVVHYPGLPSHPDHGRAVGMLSGGFGAIVTIDLGGRAEADVFIKSLAHVPYAPSLGDVSTTLSHPATTSHRFQTPAQWAVQGITPGLVRLSIGVEHPDDLWADLQRALDAVAG
jgi:cystathionine beta-lyase/cystathionine gamma-synthase